MMVIAVIIAGVVGFFAELFFRSFTNFGYYGGYGGYGGYGRGSWSSSSSNESSSSDNRKGSGGGAIIVIIIAVALIALAWALSQMVRLALSRSREYLADAGSVELTKNPDAMISALRKIENRGELPGATSAVMELCLDNPRQGFSDLFATHPSVDARVQALVKFAGGHDPGPIALPSPADGPDDQAQGTDGQTPPPVPKGPWSDATDPAGDASPAAPPGQRSGPWGSATGPSSGPFTGPWGHH
jgi:heat shock protein HtpX